MACAKLSDKLIRTLRTEKKSEEFLDDCFTHGQFGVRVSSGGKKAFFLRYLVNGRGLFLESLEQRGAASMVGQVGCVKCFKNLVVGIDCFSHQPDTFNEEFALFVAVLLVCEFPKFFEFVLCECHGMIRDHRS